MRSTVTVVALAQARRDDAVVSAPGTAASGDVVARLADLIGVRPEEPVLVDGRPLDPLTPLSAGPLRDGAVVSFGDATEPDDAPRGCVELRVVGGPASGACYPLRLGATVIGRGAGSDIVLDDPDVSRRHAVLTIADGEVSVADAGSTNGTTLDAVPVGATPVRFSVGMRLRLGESTLALAVPDEPPVMVTSTPDGGRGYNRPPRLNTTPPPATVEFPSPPTARAPGRLPLIATIAPLLAGVVLALLMRRPEYLLFTVLSPLMMVGQWLSDRVGARRTGRAERLAFESRRRAARARLSEALAVEAADLRRRFPDPAALSRIALSPTARLWERRPDDADFLRLRLGLGEQPAAVRILNADDVPILGDVPVTVSLREARVLGIAGPRARVTALARSLISQLATLHSPRDVGVVLLTDAARAGAWQWSRWLPHLRPSRGAACQAAIGVDDESAASRIAELAALVAARRESFSRQRIRHRTIVVVVDGARALRGVPGLADVLSQGPDVDVLAICLDADESRLSEECGAVAAFSGEVATRLWVRALGEAAPSEAIADGVTEAWVERIARALSPLRDESASSGGEGLPDSVRWREIAGLADAALTNGIGGELLQRWRRSTGGSTKALIGAGIDGSFSIDLARDGPHALVAGTTGSGKSELLQTLVATLAVANRPDELTFVLVDYKGGAAFGACATLPHTVGLVTDLDGSLVERAMASLSAELKRRESLLAEAGVANIDSYRVTGGNLARLVIVVDEFASLAEELPDFIGGLVGIAQRGRSLGVHLVLATQRPEGVVSADIRANTNLRICLAVTRDSESRDVIDTADAARISRATPGRGYARTGHGELHAFQSGRIGCPAVADDADDIDVRRTPFLSLALAAPPLPQRHDDQAKTDLDLIVDACREAAIRLEIETPASPWLAPLPDVVVAPAHDAPLTATLGLRDIPARQAREWLAFDLAVEGHLLVAGSARSGRTTALRTLAGALVRSTPVADLHIYAFDCAGGSLSTFDALPNCGAVVATHEPDRARRLTSLLIGELVSRQSAFAAAGFGSLAEQRVAGGVPPPHIVVFVDGWEAFTAAHEDVDAGAIVDGAFRLLREGASVGIHVVVSAERAGLVGRLPSTIENRLVLRLADRGDFALIGLPARSVPANLPAGRAFSVTDLVETHVCLLDAEPSGAAQLTALSEIAAMAAARDAELPGSARPRRVDPLPTQIALAQLTTPLMAGSARVTLGVGGDELSPLSVDLLENGPGFVVAGPPRSGRSTALATIGLGLLACGWKVVGITARPSPLDKHIETVFDAADPGLSAALESDDALAVLVDDAELVGDTPAAATLDRVARAARDTRRILVVAGNTDDLAIGFRGFVVDARRSRCGILLTPRTPLDGEVLGIRLPRDTGGRLPAGRGLFVSRGEAVALQVALPPAS